ncbi:hypothetical protein [Biformimicrobium ophioploci]|uniref:Uncharacterized protein n=1 Tax=Biformimicrobium ophioploci TaxID=3036711 RepID=A0ABQ6M2C5_9GAMM|nr:hypothetical protein [Microbulbifer sp. NKW57]GMG88495.1 hypothetical protein MNKW57_28160 [Microbulbifer sp. NKW57]
MLYRLAPLSFVFLLLFLPDQPSADHVYDQSPYVHFCRAEYFKYDEGQVKCNWAGSFDFACEIKRPNRIPIEEGSLLREPEDVGECSDGERVLKIVHY